MTPRERLHRLVDVLPEAMLADVERVLVLLVLGARATSEARAQLEAELAAPGTSGEPSGAAPAV